MTDVELIVSAAEAMRVDPDPRWHPVADLIESNPLRYAQLAARHPQAVGRTRGYPDAGRAVAVARAYLQKGP